jgi:MFS family permease
MERVINLVGPFGKYQKLILFLGGFISAFSAISIYATVFSAADPGLVCTFRNETDEIKNLPNQCDIWNKTQECRRDHTNESLCEYTCEFSRKYYGTTMVTEWKLICDQKFLVGLTQTIYMIGTISGLCVGYFGDRYGRKRCSLVILIVTALTLIVSELSQLRVFNLSTTTMYIIYVTGQFIIGALCKALYIFVYILVFEFTSAEYSTIVTNIYMCAYVIGELLVLAVEFTFRNWHAQTIFMIVYAITLIFLVAFLLPESPRYLLSMGMNAKAVKLFKKIQRFNGKPSSSSSGSGRLGEESLNNEDITEELLNEDKIRDETSNDEQERGVNVRQLWHPRVNLVKTFAFVYIWLALSLLYYGVSLGNKRSHMDQKM